MATKQKEGAVGVMEPATYTVNQAWNRIGKKNITRQALYLAAERGDFPSIRLGRRILIPRYAFEQFLLGAQAKPQNPSQ
jgi:hypothetical protein